MDNIIKLKIGGMACGGCALAVQDVLEKVAGVTGAKVDHTTGTAEVHVDNPAPTADQLISAVERSGYRAST